MNTPNWKKTTEELPPTEVNVLGYRADWTEPVWPCLYNGDGWVQDGHLLAEPSLHPDDAPPTHWMPLPFPPDTQAENAIRETPQNPESATEKTAE